MLRRLLPLAAVLALTATGAAAENLGPVSNAAAQKECSVCHMAYQPQFLAADSWSTIFADLANHFGNDASLPEATLKEIADYYVANAGKPVGGRITETKWWVRRHSELPDAWWVKVKYKGNCVACHKNAEQGYYSEEE
jgi:hypothetical protein